MSASYKHTLAGLFALTVIVALLALASHGQAHAEPPAPAGGATEVACDANAIHEFHRQRAQRSAVRAQLSMPYFSYSRALPRTAEL